MKNTYRIYLNNRDRGPDFLTPVLYAFTDNKSYYKKFKEFRNMELFSVIKEKMSEEDYDMLKHLNHKLELKEIILKTRKPNTINTVSEIRIVGTRREEFETMIGIETIFETISKHMKFPIECFNEKYRELLSELGYRELFNWSRAIYPDFDNPYNEFDSIIYDEKGNAEVGSSLSAIFDVDEFEIFLKLFGGTLKINKSKE